MEDKITISTHVQQDYSCVNNKDIWGSFWDFCESNYSPRKLFIIIDENVNELHGDEIRTQCSRYFQECYVIEIEAGEQSKSFNVWSNLVDQLLKAGIERTTPVLAVGGGVTGDVAGYAAATALRGVPLLHMPTSLLAMVDSSIGGKTGINHSKGKNLIGSFYQPDAVFSHLPFLETLPGEEWINGLSEILKYAAIRNPQLFEELDEAVKSFTPNERWEQIIVESVQIKSAIVEADTREAGKRAFLNFGHTFGHALEKWADFGAVSHGEGVFAGMLAAAYLSNEAGASLDLTKFDSFKSSYNIQLPEKSEIEALIDLMYTDKKVKNGSLYFILLNKWGDPFVKKVDNERLLTEAWNYAFSKLKSD